MAAIWGGCVDWQAQAARENMTSISLIQRYLTEDTIRQQRISKQLNTNTCASGDRTSPLKKKSQLLTLGTDSRRPETPC